MPTARDIAACIALNLAASGGAPEWIELLPAGTEIKGRDTRGWSKPDAVAIVAATRAAAGNVPLHVDYEHASEHRARNGQEAPAAGWIADLEVRDGGAIWGRVEWTARAAQMIAAREYRFLSPVFIYDPTTREVRHLVSAGLTNQPNLELRALNKRGEPDDTPSASPPTKEQSRMTPESAKALCRKLGLQAEASDDAILTAVDTLITDKATALNQVATPDLKKFVPRADYDKVVGERDTALNTLDADKKARTEAEITSAVDAAVAAGKIAPASKSFYLATCRTEAGLAEFKKFVDTAPVLTGAVLDNKEAPAAGSAALTAEEKALCQRMGLTEDAYKAAKVV